MGGGSGPPVRLTQCPAGPHVVATSQGSWWSRITGDRVQLTGRDTATVVQGRVLEFVNGNKYFYINGRLEEFFLSLKNEQIVGLETKLNMGALIELILIGKSEINHTYAVEVDRGPKYHLLAAGHGVLTPEHKIEAAKSHRMAATVSNMISSFSASVAEKQKIIANFRENVGKLERKASTLNQTMTDSEVVFGKAKFTGTSIKRGVSNETVDASNWQVETKGASIVEAPSITLEGGGGKLEIGPIVSGNNGAFRVV